MVTVSDNKWIEKFFAEGNAWNLDNVRQAKYPGELQTLLETMLQPCYQGRPPFVLPRVDEHKRLWFYLIGEDRRQLGEFQRVVAAYLGNVMTRFDPRIFTESDENVERSLLARFPHGFSKISVPPKLNADKASVYSVFQTLNSATERYSQRPTGVSLVHRPIGRVLSDFFVACSRGDGAAALEYLSELRVSGGLSTQNLLSLEFQAMAAGGDWRAIVSHPSLPDILSGRIPGVIVDVVLNAVMHTSVRLDDPADNDIDELRADLQRISTVFLRTPDVDVDRQRDLWKVWSLGAAALGYSRVLEIVPLKSVGKKWVDRLAHWAGLTSQETAEVDPLSFALQQQPSLDNAVVLLQQSLVANQRDSLTICRRISDFPSTVIERIEAHNQLRNLWKSLKEEYSTAANIDGWSSWLNALLDDSNDVMSLSSVVENCRNWDADLWVEGQVTGQLFALADSKSSSTVRDVVPVLRQWLLERDIEMSAEFIEQIMFILSVDDIYSTQDLALFAELIGDIVDVAHTKKQYSEAIGAIENCWTQIKSVNSLEQGLEIMDVLLDSVCANEQARLGFWNKLQEFCITNWDRLTEDQQLVAMRISETAVGISTQFPKLLVPEDSGTSPRIDLSNKKLAIYTLTEGAARRAGAVLAELFPGMQIKLNHDKTATEALVNLAKTADYFVFASRSAAHQAFYPVTKARDEILYPAGKGSSSIVRCFLDAIQG